MENLLRVPGIPGIRKIKICRDPREFWGISRGFTGNEKTTEKFPKNLDPGNQDEKSSQGPGNSRAEQIVSRDFRKLKSSGTPGNFGGFSRELKNDGEISKIFWSLESREIPGRISNAGKYVPSIGRYVSK